jgi:hypothetical protein
LIQKDCLKAGLKGYFVVKELQRRQDALNGTFRKLTFVEQVQQ